MPRTNSGLVRITETMRERVMRRTMQYVNAVAMPHAIAAYATWCQSARPVSLISRACNANVSGAYGNGKSRYGTSPAAMRDAFSRMYERSQRTVRREFCQSTTDALPAPRSRAIRRSMRGDLLVISLLIKRLGPVSVNL